MQNLDPQRFKSGIPSIQDVEVVEKFESFKSMREYSNSFLLNNKYSLDSYRWIKDSFNQWSRIYEYPYCFDAIKENISNDATMLDAGSGVTFFPFFMSSKYKLTCIDRDDYSEIFNNINKNQGTNVYFKKTTLQNISLPDNTFDAIYCISVLEHTKDYVSILNEFRRILKPNGLIVITFDISLDTNKWGIDRDTSIALIDTISKFFGLEYTPMNLINDLEKKDIYTTGYVQKYKSHKLLPWPKYSVKNIITNLLLKREIMTTINLTFCNIIARKV
jgi:ubiquinone/menaquinone biosynthesis C-methylase UbiE